MQCPECQYENPSGAKFCIECASPIERRCPACGTEAPPAAKVLPRVRCASDGQVPTTCRSRDESIISFDRNRRAPATRCLPEIYNWFTEGFDTNDLQEATHQQEQPRAVQGRKEHEKTTEVPYDHAQ